MALKNVKNPGKRCFAVRQEWVKGKIQICANQRNLYYFILTYILAESQGESKNCLRNCERHQASSRLPVDGEGGTLGPLPLPLLMPGGEDEISLGAGSCMALRGKN